MEALITGVLCGLQRAVQLPELPLNPTPNCAQLSGKEWSAPSFFTVYSIGVGLTVGFARIDSVILLNSEEALRTFTQSQVCRHSIYRTPHAQGFAQCS